MLLWWLSLVVAVLVVLVLAAYLTAIAYFLWKADRHLARLVGGLQATRGHVRPLPERLTTINQALGALRSSLQSTDRHLAGAARLFEER
jgi:hypothetical protein